MTDRLRPDRGRHQEAAGRLSSAPPTRCRASSAWARTRWQSDFTQDHFAAILGGRCAQIKGVLRDQGIIAGIGNAYSDEILHVAKMSPFALASSLMPMLWRGSEAMRETLASAVATASANRRPS